MQFDIKLQSLINNSPVIIFLCKAKENWPVELLSENISQFGYREEEFISGNLQYLDIVYPEDLERVKAEIFGYSEEGREDFTQEYRIQTDSEDVLWVEAKIRVQFGKNGEVTHYQGTVYNITQRKIAEESMQKALEKKKELETVINSSPVIVFLWRAEEGWPVELVSENITKLGYSPEEFTTGKLLYTDIIHPEDLARVWAEASRAAEEGKKELTQEYRVLTKDGDAHYVEERNLIRRNGEGRVTHYQGIILDISEKKKAEESMHLAQKKKDELTEVINSSPLYVFLCGTEEGWPVEFTAENIRRLGYTPEEFTSGKIKYLDIVHPEDRERILAEVARYSREGYTECT